MPDQLKRTVGLLLCWLAAATCVDRAGALAVSPPAPMASPRPSAASRCAGTRLHEWRGAGGEARPFELRMGVEPLRNPDWYAEHGQPDEARQFWDRQAWDRRLREWAGEGYNALLFWVEPWTPSQTATR